MQFFNTILFFSTVLGFFGQACIEAKEKKCSLSADYIVVGIGTAGAVVAKRLSDDCKTSVIGLHIGRNLTDDPLIRLSKNATITVPAIVFGQPPLYENQLTIPQAEDDDRELLCGFALPEGGASSVNAGVYCLASDELYAQWEAIAGRHWSVNRILRINKALETYVGETDHPELRGSSGPIEVRQVPDPSKLSLTFTQAMVEATGTQELLDYNVPPFIGVCPQLQYTQKGINGRLRVSSATAFLNESVMTPKGEGVCGRKLRILFRSPALRTIWDGNRAIGVQYLSQGKIKKVFAKKGVIVCCGLKSSPFLLHSGVGPRALLKSLGIPVVFDNPNVGQGLADQPGVRTVWKTNRRDNPILFQGLFGNIASLRDPRGRANPRKRSIRLASIFLTPGAALVTCDLLQPKSRGSITINSPDPLDPPVIDLGVFSNRDDFELFLAAFQVYVKRINEKIQLIDPKYQLIFPNPAILDDEALLGDFVLENVACNQHFQSHCRMASLKNGGVVNSRGQVYGTKNLWVADDSIVPLCMDGSPMSSAYLIGANVSELIISGEKD